MKVINKNSRTRLTEHILLLLFLTPPIPVWSTHFSLIIYFYIYYLFPLENIRDFWCFYGVQKYNVGLQWVDTGFEHLFAFWVKPFILLKNG